MSTGCCSTSNFMRSKLSYVCVCVVVALGVRLFYVCMNHFFLCPTGWFYQEAADSRGDLHSSIWAPQEKNLINLSLGVVGSL